jgi:hypothetical protein
LRFHEVVLAPIKTGGTNRLKGFLMVPALALVWLIPRKPALEMIRRLLELPPPRGGY